MQPIAVQAAAPEQGSSWSAAARASNLRSSVLVKSLLGLSNDLVVALRVFFHYSVLGFRLVLRSLWI